MNELNDVHNKIVELEKEISDKKTQCDQYIIKYNNLLISYIKNTYSSVWIIKATPSKPISPVKNACIFLSYLEASQHMPKNNSTFDYDCSCRWTYEIIETDINKLSDDEIINIGKIPIDYPYYGW